MDAGLHWQTMHSGTSMELRKGLIEPGTGNVLIAGRGGTLLRSVDGGRTWSTVNTHTTRHFTSIAANTAGDLIAVGERIVRLTPQEPP